MKHFFQCLILLLSSVPAASSSDAAAYFANIAVDEKEEYTNWLTDRSPSFSRHAFLPSSSSAGGDTTDDGAAIFWEIDGDSIDFAVAVRADGWVGFGISEAGGMLGADMALYEASASETLIDAHVVEDRATPLTDDCQDWKLNAAMNDGGWIIVEMTRLLDTQDSQDHSIQRDVDGWFPPTRVIAAWGDTDSVSYHFANKARSSVRLFSDSNDSEVEALASALERESDGYFDIREDEHEIPAVDTEYHEVCKTFAELNIGLPEGQSMATMIGGDQGYILPDDVGFPLFDTESNQAVRIQIHYNNPSLIKDMKDSSGIRIYYTHSKREQEAALLQLGDPLLRLDGEQINSGLTQHQFNCPGTCSSNFLGNQGVTVLWESLHMHQAGVRMTNEVIRDGSVFHTAAADVFDFDQQGSIKVQQDPYEILPGDSFQTTCYYRDGARFGLSSQEEMCIAFLLYYPAKKFLSFPWICPYTTRPDNIGIGCKEEMENADLDGDDKLGRRFGASSSECAMNSLTVDAPLPGSTESPSNLAANPPARSATNPPTRSPTAKPTSGAGWRGVSSWLKYISVLPFLI